jgi:hypothetical protein
MTAFRCLQVKGGPSPGPLPHGQSCLCSSATTHCAPSHAPIPPVCSACPTPRAGACWPSMVSNRTSAMRGCGASGTAAPGQSSWPAVCCLRPHLPAPSGSGPCGTTGRDLWSASCRTAHSPSAVPSRRCAPRCPTPWGTAMLSARPRSLLMPPTALPSTPANRVSVGSAPWHGASPDGLLLPLKSCGAPGRPCGVPSRRMAAPPGGLGAHTPRPPHGDDCPSRAGRQKGALPQALRRLQGLRARGVRDTAAVWPDGRVGYHGGQPAAHILSNPEPPAASPVQRRRGGRLGARTRPQAAAGTLAPALGHVRTVTRSDWPGRFACSTGPELPRTPKALAQFCGASREHDRRPPGRTVASPGVVLSGSVWVMAATATRRPTYAAAALAPENVKAWQELRQARETRRQQRTRRRRFRRDPVAYLATLEMHLLQLILPP